MKNVWIILLLGLAVFLMGCSSETRDSGEKPESPVLLLEYDDFGPQVIAHELIGFGWNQWDPCGNEGLPPKCDIKVVIYRGAGIDEIKKRFPVIRDKSDFRYVEYDTAVSFLRSKIAEMNEWLCDNKDDEDDETPKMIKRILESTLAAVENAWAGAPTLHQKVSP